jgi:hypothetical protein
MTDRPYRSNKTVRHVVFKHFIELASATYSKDALPVDSMMSCCQYRRFISSYRNIISEERQNSPAPLRAPPVAEQRNDNLKTSETESQAWGLNGKRPFLQQDGKHI